MANQITYTDSSLISLLKSGSEAAFEHLYHNYKAALFTIIVQIIPDNDEASDVLQEVFITVWKNFDKYDATKGRLFTWLLNVARNCAINKARSKNYKNHQKINSIENYVNYAGNADMQIPNINAIGLKKQVSQLKTDYKNVLELSYFVGLTHDEIAKALDIPSGTVKTRIRNAIIELRKQFM